LVSKVAARRDDVGAVLPFDDPDQLRAGIEDNLAALGVEQITAVNLRVMDKRRAGRTVLSSNSARWSPRGTKA